MLETRHGKQYRCEMDDDQHIELLKVLLKHQGPVLLSGYASALYDDYLRGWHKEETISYNQAAQKRREVLWMNFDPGNVQMKMVL